MALRSMKWYAVGYVDHSSEKVVERFGTQAEAYKRAQEMGISGQYHHADYATYTRAARRRPPRYTALETFAPYQPFGARSRDLLLAGITECDLVFPSIDCEAVEEEENGNGSDLLAV